MTDWTDDSGRVRISLADGVADVRLTRGDKMNALDPAMFRGISAAIEHLGRQAGVRCVVLSGEGRAFCAGLDMQSMAADASLGADLTVRTNGIANSFQHVSWGWRQLAVPVIAAVHGVALGGGCQIISGADIRFAHPETRLSVMELKWGLVPDMGGIALWRGLVRDDVLRDLAYSARQFTAAEGQALGFVTHLSETPHDAAMAAAQVIAGHNPDAVRGIKRLVNAMPDEPSPALLIAESVEQAAVLRTANQMEAVRANFERRAPQFVDPEPLAE